LTLRTSSFSPSCTAYAKGYSESICKILCRNLDKKALVYAFRTHFCNWYSSLEMSSLALCNAEWQRILKLPTDLAPYGAQGHNVHHVCIHETCYILAVSLTCDMCMRRQDYVFVATHWITMSSSIALIRSIPACATQKICQALSNSIVT